MNTPETESGLVRIPGSEVIEVVPISSIRPARVNDIVYKPVDSADPAIQDLAAKIRDQGLLEPIVATLDNVILSGHRRRVASLVAGLKQVKIRRHPILSTDANFLKLLVSYNSQRVKSVDEQLREAVVTVNKDDAYKSLIEHRREQARRPLASAAATGVSIRRVEDARRRAAITPAKQPMLDAALAVLNANRDYWPLTVRQVHYRLLNDPPLRHARKLNSRYVNDEKSYKDLSNLLSRARLTGQVEWDSIFDPTRPHTSWRVWSGPAPFINREVEQFLCGYRRDLLQSQEAYYEIVGEKMTVQTIIENVAGQYGMTCSIGRGYSSVDLRRQIAERFEQSGKDSMFLLLVGDFDPEGENITSTMSSSLQDEFGVTDIMPVKVALTYEQVQHFGLPPGGRVKAASSRTKAFRARYGENVYELEALQPAELTRLVREAIEGVLDLDLLHAEQAQEATDAAELEVNRQRLRASFT